MKRKATAICLLAVILLLFFGGCAKQTVFMTVDDKSVSKELYTYYLDKVLSSHESYGIEAADRDAASDSAVMCCKQYVASLKLMEKEGITFSAMNKQLVADKVEKLWSLYSAYYERLGISKPDITEAISHEYRIKQIIDYYYGPDGLEPTDDADLKEEFVDLYVGFRAISVPLTKTDSLGQEVPLTEKEKEEVMNVFRAYRTQINEGEKTIDEVNVAYNNSLDIIVTENLEINVVKIGDPMFIEEFYSTMLEISHTRAGLIDCGNTLYLVQREKIATTDDDEFYLYRSDLIEELKGDDARQKVDEFAQTLTCEFDKETAKEIYGWLYEDKEKTDSPDEVKTLIPKLKEE